MTLPGLDEQLKQVRTIIKSLQKSEQKMSATVADCDRQVSNIIDDLLEVKRISNDAVFHIKRIKTQIQQSMAVETDLINRINAAKEPKK